MPWLDAMRLKARPSLLPQLHRDARLRLVVAHGMTTRGGGPVAGGLVRPLVTGSAVGGATRWGRRGPKAVGRVLSLCVAVEHSSAL